MYPWSNGDTIPGAKQDVSGVYLRCVNHPHMRWHTKNIMYVGARTIFYFGIYVEGKMPKKFVDGIYYPECPCDFKCLEIAPESRAEEAE